MKQSEQNNVTWKQTWKQMGKSLIVLTIILFTFDYFNALGWGIAIFILFTLGYGSYRLYQNRESLMVNIRYIETMIWGKPLDRENWGKDERPKGIIKLFRNETENDDEVLQQSLSNVQTEDTKKSINTKKSRKRKS